MIADRTSTSASQRLLADSLRHVRRPLVIAALFAMSGLGVWNLVGIFQTSPYTWHDFTQDYVSAEDVLAGRNPFRPQNQRIGELFDMPAPKEGPAYSFHPPTTLVFFIPLALLSYQQAFVVWGLASLACLWLIVDLTARALGRPLRALAGLALALGLVAVWPLRENFVEGQLNVAVAAGIVGCWYARRIERPVLAGVALAIAIALKPLVGLFVLWALWRREWRLLTGASVALGAVTVVGAMLAGVDGVRDYLTAAYPMHAALWPGYKDNASPQGFFTRLFGPSDWKPRPPYPIRGLSTGLTLTSWAVAVGLLFWRIGRRPPSPDRLNREFAALGATMLLVTPIIWPHYYVVLAAPVAVFVASLWRRRAWGWLALLSLAIGVLLIPRGDLLPRGLGNAQLPALLAMYAVGLAVLGRAGEIIPGKAETREARAGQTAPEPGQHGDAASGRDRTGDTPSGGTQAGDIRPRSTGPAGAATQT
ncbi:MAG: DUF2029 domain-containing protein [Chloroflexi bacterium]|nr:DUF2029 domain-containing protein [Chloroflexota bacterium]